MNNELNVCVTQKSLKILISMGLDFKSNEV
jgi:hypothetical protein